MAAVLAGLGYLWLAGHATATVVVDGQVSTVETHAATVGQMLERAGVEVGSHDRVEPAVDAPVVDGMLVEVVHARDVTVLVGDTERRAVVTALTVDEVLGQLGRGALDAPAGRRDLVRPSRMSRVSSGMVIELSDPVALSVIVDGQRHEVITDEPTVGAVLEGLDVELGPHDRVVPDVGYPSEHGIVVTVRRVEVSEEAREEPIAFPTEERRTAALRQGERREARSGQAGLVRVVEEVTRVDGAEQERRVVEEETVREPQARVVEVGTAPPPRPAARTEADPSPPEPGPEAAPAPNARVQEGKASWYDNPHGGYTGAHRSIPRGTLVTVTNLANGRSVQVRINDRGPFVDGRVIDLNRAAFEELAPTSRGVVRVRLEW